MWREIARSIQLDATYEANKAVLSDLVGVLKARRIKFVYAVGRGTSDHALIYFKYLAETLAGVPVALGACSVFTMYGGLPDLSQCLVLGVSQSGRAEDVIGVLRAAKAQGAVVAAVTNDEQSPMARLADHCLVCACGEEKSVAATKTFTAQLYLLTMLADAWAADHPLSQTARILPCRLAERFAEIDRLTDGLARRLTGVDEGFVLARGLSGAIAFECALKLQETSYMRMRAYHSSDFYHGPMAMVSSGTCVLAFYSGRDLRGRDIDARGKDIERFIGQMASSGAELTLITDDRRAAALCGNALLLQPFADEVEGVFAFALFAQMLACKVSCARGCDPDAPRALKKVTVTI